MNLAEPIKNKEDLEKFKNYYQDVKPNGRNKLLVTMGLNTALRISDILSLKWEIVFDFEKKIYRDHIIIMEQKTGKRTQIYMNSNLLEALDEYKNSIEEKQIMVEPDTYLFPHSNKNISITRSQAFRIIKEAADYYNLSGVISCHSLRKTFGYHAWKQGVPPVLLVTIFNHSSFHITKRYLGIEQDDRDDIFKKVKL